MASKPVAAASKSPPAELRRRREQMLLRLLIRLSRVMSDETTRRVVERGHHELQASYLRLLGNLDVDGTRVNALARRMGVTRQGASQLIDEIEKIGCIERCADPDDRRAVIVRFTAKGKRMLADGIEAMLEIEAEYAAIIGKSQLKQIKADLTALVEVVDPEGALGKD